MVSNILAINLKKFFNQKLNMSSKLHKYIETAIDKKQNLLNAKIINFPNEKNINDSVNLKLKKNNHWSIKDDSNIDQLKAVTGICFMIGILTIVGLYSNLM